MIDFSGPAFEALTAMGLLPQPHAAASPVDTFRYIDHEGRTTVSLDYELFTKTLDGEIVSIMRPALEQMLRESLGPRVNVRHGTTVEQITPGAAVLSDGNAVDADPILGADGIHSRTRSLDFGEEARFMRDVGMHTGAFIFDDHDWTRPWRVAHLLRRSTSIESRRSSCRSGRMVESAWSAMPPTPCRWLPARARRSESPEPSSSPSCSPPADQSPRS